MNLTSSFWRLTEGRQHVAELQIQKENLDITMWSCLKTWFLDSSYLEMLENLNEADPHWRKWGN